MKTLSNIALHAKNHLYLSGACTSEMFVPVDAKIEIFPILHEHLKPTYLDVFHLFDYAITPSMQDVFVSNFRISSNLKRITLQSDVFGLSPHVRDTLLKLDLDFEAPEYSEVNPDSYFTNTITYTGDLYAYN